MTKQRQIEEAARIDGYTAGDKITFPQYFYKGSEIFTRNELPDYLNDFNDVHRLIAGMDKKHRDCYFDELCKICTGHQWDGDKWLMYEYEKIVQSTCPQILEAALRAYGKWEEGHLTGEDLNR